MWMDQERRKMAEEPEDGLEALFRQEEAAIRDDGFSARVAGQVSRAQRFRNLVIYGAGMAGFGVAVGGISKFAGAHPLQVNWMAPVDNARDLVAGGGVFETLSSAGPMWMVVAAAAAGVGFFLVSVLTQER
jgi:hypothetical protein